MRSIFFFITMFSLIICGCNNNDVLDMPPPTWSFVIRLVNTQGDWIDEIEKKELKLLVADNHWNILDKQPKMPSEDSYDYPTQKIYNLYSKNISYVLINAYTMFFSINGKRFGDYLILRVDEKTDIKIQLIFKEKYQWFIIEKIICNGKEYSIQDIKDIVIE